MMSKIDADCSRAKVTRQPAAAVALIPVPTSRFTHPHMDLVGWLPMAASKHKYIFTVFDRSIRWAETMALVGVSASDCADALIAVWVS
jgi:hypothetical protein